MDEQEKSGKQPEASSAESTTDAEELIGRIYDVMEEAFTMIADTTRTGKQVNEDFVECMLRFFPLRDQMIVKVGEFTVIDLMSVAYDTVFKKLESNITKREENVI